MANRLHYGWLVCLAGTLLLFVTMGTVSNGFSVYLPFIMKEHGLSNSMTSSLVTIRCLVAFISMLCIGLYYKAFSLRIGTFIAAAFAGISLLMYSFASSYAAFCVSAAVSGLSYGFGSMIPVSILMNKWFFKHKALAISICGTGTGIATIILAPIITMMVENVSLTFSFRIEGAAALVLAVVIFLIVRNEPGDIGLQPLGTDERRNGDRAEGKTVGGSGVQGEAGACDETHNVRGSGAKDNTAETGARSGRGSDSESNSTVSANSTVNTSVSDARGSESEAIATESTNVASNPISKSLSLKAFILLGGASLFMGALANPGFSHLSVLFTSEGYIPMTVAAVISFTGVMMVFSKIAYGSITDKIGGYKSNILFGTILVIGHILCCFAFTGQISICIAAAIGLGVGYPITTIGIPVWSNDMVTQDNYAKTVRRLQVIYAAGALIFASIPGILADIFSGSYIPAYILFTVLMALATVFSVLAYKIERKRFSIKS